MVCFIRSSRSNEPVLSSDVILSAMACPMPAIERSSPACAIGVDVPIEIGDLLGGAAIGEDRKAILFAFDVEHIGQQFKGVGDFLIVHVFLRECSGWREERLRWHNKIIASPTLRLPRLFGASIIMPCRSIRKLALCFLASMTSSGKSRAAKSPPTAMWPSWSGRGVMRVWSAMRWRMSRRCAVAARDQCAGQDLVAAAMVAAKQRMRLEAEGIEFDARGKIDLKRFRWAGPGGEFAPSQPSLFE